MKKIEQINNKIEEKRKILKLLKELQKMLSWGTLTNEYFEGQIKDITLEHNGLVDAYNILMEK